MLKNYQKYLLTHIVVAQYNTLSNSNMEKPNWSLFSEFKIQKKSLVHIVAAQYKAQNSA